MASEQLKQMNELYASIKENSCGLLRDRDPSESSAGQQGEVHSRQKHPFWDEIVHRISRSFSSPVQYTRLSSSPSESSSGSPLRLRV
jgi:hypothetical protein